MNFGDAFALLVIGGVVGLIVGIAVGYAWRDKARITTPQATPPDVWIHTPELWTDAQTQQVWFAARLRNHATANARSFATIHMRNGFLLDVQQIQALAKSQNTLLRIPPLPQGWTAARMYACHKRIFEEAYRSTPTLRNSTPTR